MPDTRAYLLLGLVVIALFLAAQVISLVLRRRIIERDNALLDELERDGTGTPSHEDES